MLPNIEERKEPRAIDELREQDMPLPVLSTELATLALLNLLYERTIMEEGRSPNFQIREFDLAAAARVTVNADFNPDRWIVYFRADPLITLRVFPGDDAPTTGSIEIVSGQMAIISNRNERMAFHNSGTSATDAHIFAIAIGGGSEFGILSI